MTTLGYALPPSSANAGGNAGQLQYAQRGTGSNRPAPLMSQSLYRSRTGMRAEPGQRNNQKRSGIRVVRGEREDGVAADMEKRRGKEGRRGEESTAAGRSGGSKEKGRGESRRRGKRDEPETGKWTASMEEERAGWRQVEDVEELQGNEDVEMWGRKRRLLSISDYDEETGWQTASSVEVLYPSTGSTGFLQPPTIQIHNQYSYNLNLHHPDPLRKEDGFTVERDRELKKQTDVDVMSTFYHQRRPPRSLLSPTLQPPISTLSLLYQFGASEEHALVPQPLSLRRGTSLLSPPLTPLLSSTSSSSSLLSVRPTMNDFARKVEGFWILRELQSWLWRSAKDFNRLKRRLRG